jgi:DNA-K related protein
LSRALRSKPSRRYHRRNLARRSGQRALDVDDAHRDRVLAVLRTLDGIPPAWLRLVEEVVEPEGEEQSRMFGESLPIGLRLLRPEE